MGKSIWGDKTNLIVIMLAKFVTCILLSGHLSATRNASQAGPPRMVTRLTKMSAGGWMKDLWIIYHVLKDF